MSRERAVPPRVEEQEPITEAVYDEGTQTRQDDLCCCVRFVSVPVGILSEHDNYDFQDSYNILIKNVYHLSYS